MEKADWAILISSMASFASLATAVITWLIWRNDRQKMRRPLPALELRNYPGDRAEIIGWQTKLITVRNRADVGVVVQGIETRNRKALIYSEAEASDGVDSLGGPKLRSILGRKRYAAIETSLKPNGTQLSNNYSTGDTLHIKAFTRNVEKSKDLKLIWEWADGEKR